MFHKGQWIFFANLNFPLCSSVADPDPGSGAFLTLDPDPQHCFLDKYGIWAGS
jgi:hypothetical protein